MTTNQDQVEIIDDVWGDDFEDDKYEAKKILEAQVVTSQDKFNLAKKILLVAAVVFVLIAAAQAFSDRSGVEKVWDYSSVALNSIISVIIGYYFGKE